MRPCRRFLGTLARLAVSVVVWIAFAPSHAAVAQVATSASGEKDTGHGRIAFSQALPRLDGTQLKATIVEVTYGPGASSPPHSHPCPVIGYVIEGSLRTQVKGEAEAIYNAGQSFYEAPNGVHMISANASDKAPVKLLAYFVCDHNMPLSVAPPGTAPSGGKKP
ncbi:MAG TPA: cupin domain-containing protein [Candidatus Sulfotelmatobacter sp.]|nr:cupin domain-containing protein [Candidatus Sulfotelmatobacter sp.]